MSGEETDDRSLCHRCGTLHMGGHCDCADEARPRVTAEQRLAANLELARRQYEFFWATHIPRGESRWDGKRRSQE